MTIRIDDHAFQNDADAQAYVFARDELARIEGTPHYPRKPHDLIDFKRMRDRALMQAITTQQPSQQR